MRAARNLALGALAALLAVALALPPAASLALAGDAPAAAAQDPASTDKDLEALKKAIEDAYLEVQRDFTALLGEKSAEARPGIARAASESLAASAGKPADEAWAAVAESWIAGKALGPIVARRLAAALRKAAGNAPDPEAVLAALEAAARTVFPEATMDVNWDKHFLDLEVVQRWAKAKAAAAAAPGKNGGGAAAPLAAEPLPDPAEMVAVPKGDLLVPDQRGRGWPDLGQKAEKRTVKAFYLDRTEVSCASYAAFLRGLKDAKLRDRVLPSGWKLDEKGAPVLPEGAARLPVTSIPYEGAAAFAASLGKRLPTEDEWERAARGDRGWKFPWGAEWAEGNAVAGGKPGPAPVGSTAADRSPFGALDLCGNVSEICATHANGKPIKGLPKPTEQVVRRGGNFKEPAEEASNDWRYVIGPTARADYVGFRCAMDEKDYLRVYGKK